MTTWLLIGNRLLKGNRCAIETINEIPLYLKMRV